VSDVDDFTDTDTHCSVNLISEILEKHNVSGVLATVTTLWIVVHHLTVYR